MESTPAVRSHRWLFLMLGILIGLMLSGTAVAASYLTKAKADARYLQEKTKVLVSDDFDVLAGTFYNAPISCPNGYQALSGGYELQTPGFVGVTATADHPMVIGTGSPYPRATGWHVVLKSTAATDVTANVSVVCAR